MTLAWLLLFQEPLDAPALAKPVTLRRDLALVGECLGDVATQTGARLRLDPRFQNVKLHVFVKDLPARDLLRHAATVIQGEWVAEGPVLLLRPDNRLTAERNAYLATEERLARKALDWRIRWRIQASELSPAQIKAQIDDLYDRQIRLSPESPEYRRLVEERYVVNEGREKASWAMGHLFRDLDAEARRRFWSGEIVWTGTSVKHRPPLPKDLPTWGDNLTDVPGSDPWGPPLGTDEIYLWRWDPDLAQVREGKLSRSPEGQTGSSISYRTLGADAYDSLPYGTSIADALAKEPFATRETAWARRGKLDALPFHDLKSFPPSRWESRLYGPGDHLRYLHEVTGVPIVALAFRDVHAWSKGQGRAVLRPDGDMERKPIAGVGTVGAYLNNWEEDEYGQFREEDGVLLYRPRDWHRRWTAEPDERELRRLEAVKDPTLLDFARFGATLSNAQRRVALYEGEFLSAVDTGLLSGTLNGVLLWAALSDGERRLLLQGKPLAYAGLGPSAGRAYRVAAVEGLLDGGTAGPALFRMLEEGGGFSRLQNLTLQAVKDDTRYTRSYPTARDQFGESAPRRPYPRTLRLRLIAGNEVVMEYLVVDPEGGPLPTEKK